jgi:hypothetical protein
MRSEPGAVATGFLGAHAWLTEKHSRYRSRFRLHPAPASGAALPQISRTGYPISLGLRWHLPRVSYHLALRSANQSA